MAGPWGDGLVAAAEHCGGSFARPSLVRDVASADNASEEMRRRALSVFAAAVFCACGVFAAFAVTGAYAHQDWCHSAHSCLSDHHTYIEEL